MTILVIIGIISTTIWLFLECHYWKLKIKIVELDKIELEQRKLLGELSLDTSNNNTEKALQKLNLLCELHPEYLNT
jgi:hypothetical protein